MDLAKYISGNRIFRTLVSILFFSCCPTAISGFIVPIVFNPINRMFFTGTSTHISNKIWVRESPSIANGYSPSTIIFIILIILVITSAFYMSPNFILLWFWLPGFSFSMGCFDGAHYLFSETSTRLSSLS